VAGFNQLISQTVSILLNTSRTIVLTSFQWFKNRS